MFPSDHTHMLNVIIHARINSSDTKHNNIAKGLLPDKRFKKRWICVLNVNISNSDVYRGDFSKITDLKMLQKLGGESGAAFRRYKLLFKLHV